MIPIYEDQKGARNVIRRWDGKRTSDLADLIAKALSEQRRFIGKRMVEWMMRAADEEGMMHSEHPEVREAIIAVYMRVSEGGQRAILGNGWFK